MKYYLIAFTSILFFYSSTRGQQSDIVGLWEVTEVIVGEKEMTPIARWMEFMPNGKQRSGNGWQQHSIGSYSYAKKAGQLVIVNTNGTRDENPPFNVQVDGDKMKWERAEGKETVTIYLKKIEQLPTAPADQLMGVWLLTHVYINDSNVTQTYNPDKNRYLHLRWDKQFRIRNTASGNQSGFYHVDGHNPLLRLFFNRGAKAEEWNFEVSESSLRLFKAEAKEEIVKVYQRIDYFP